MKHTIYEQVKKEIEIEFPVCRRFGSIYYYAKSETEVIIVEDWAFSDKGIKFGKPSPVTIFQKDSEPCEVDEFNVVFEKVKTLINTL